MDFREALGLYVKIEGIKAILIFDHPLLDELLSLGWTWKAKDNLSKLLGFYMGTDLSIARMTQYLTETLEKHLQYACKKFYSLAMRVLVANQLITSACWYMLQLWPGKKEVLEAFDKKVKDFVWSGKDMGRRPRVDYETILKPRDQGGLGLISFKAQKTTMAGKAVL